MTLSSAPSSSRRPRRWNSLRNRFLVSYLLPTALLLGATAAAGQLVAQRILEDELGRSLGTAAAVTASQLNGERLLTIAQGDDVEQTRTWKTTHRLLSEIQRASGLRRVFTVDKEGRVRVDVVGSAEEAPLPVGSQMSELARDGRELERVFGGEGSVASQVLFQGRDGRFYKTGYAPVRTSEGGIVAAVGVEGTAQFFEPLRTLTRVFGAVAAGMLAVMALVALGMTSALTRPLGRLVTAASRIGRGDLTTHVETEGTWEVGTLASELESMRHALDSRDRQLKMMLGGVAHEVRNPMGGIELFAGLLAESLPKEQTESLSHVARIRREIVYLQRIVEEFLTFAREQKLERHEVDAKSLLSMVGERLEADAQKKRVRLELEADSAVLFADENLLCAALMNLGKNAIQASPEDGVVSVRGLAVESPLRTYRVTVTDEGSGIAPALLERIFEPFYTTREQGTGLGLSLAQKLAHAHDGKLSVESAPGRTVFTFEMPRR